jgi:hypothetical protein
VSHPSRLFKRTPSRQAIALHNAVPDHHWLQRAMTEESLFVATGNADRFDEFAY